LIIFLSTGFRLPVNNPLYHVDLGRDSADSLQDLGPAFIVMLG
jgi:hypothetical protein